MNILTAMRERLDQLAVFAELDVEPTGLPTGVAGLSDASVLEVLRHVTAIANDAERLQSVIAGVAATRSRRDQGHSGLAAGQGHASPAALIQSITGGSRTDALRQLRVGAALLDEGSGKPTDADTTEPAGTGEDSPSPGTDPAAAESSARGPWHAPLRVALLEGRLTPSQHDAIRGGLGEPEAEGVNPASAALAWSVAAETLVDEAVEGASVEELRARARQMRDILDPTGAANRFQARYEKRSLRMWIDQHGQHHGHITFDDEMALFVRSMFATALRPRRGGPRFVTDAERAAAADLVDDPRTNEQLEYDLLVDVLRAGAVAEAADVFGVRQPGVRMIIVKDQSGPRDPLGRMIATGHAEDGGDALPGPIIDRALCQHGSIDVTVDGHGNPLDLGREQRLFSAKQKLALAIRDGGCAGIGCPVPAAYCESHHIDHVAGGGRTDIDRGILLCRFHHMQLHNNGWRIVRDGLGPFILIPPPGHRSPGGTGTPPRQLRTKAPWAWAWDPPPPPERPPWRTPPAPTAPPGAARSAPPTPTRAAPPGAARSAAPATAPPTPAGPALRKPSRGEVATTIHIG
ncbi:HNH endonuclease signature motif containing protein [Microbacterium sp. UBA837]|uniref:HNH endonuclease signature motif containing protein n=1 Tax=Microbacterium sp. UBA837 TaxID=1946956 RepID=UPI0025F652CD|nr:HNH endonuclease signature motif containing protein [Microbacterium sp. UBA837]